MRKTLSLAFALAATSIVAACGGGGGFTSGVSALPPGPPTNNAPNIVSMTIKIPKAPSASGAARHGNYVSPNTQSIGVVVTNAGATPSPAQFVNVSSCPQVSGVTTCTVNVAALPGSDSFAMTTYDAPNGTGNALSIGSITSTISAGVANTTLPLTLGGVISSISIIPHLATLPLAQSETVNVVAKDASGAAIVGTYDSTLSLGASNLVISPSSLTNSNDASKVSIAWTTGYSSSTPTTINAHGDLANGSQVIAPGTGFAYYLAGASAVTDAVGFKAIMGPDGNLYYTSLGPVVCSTIAPIICQAQLGAVHQFNVVTNVDTEVQLQGEGVGLHFSTDGALWIAGGPPTSAGAQYLYRMAPGVFSLGGLSAIPMPTPVASNSAIRSVTEDNAGNMWFVNMNGHKYMKIPAAGPYTTSSITTYTLPIGLIGTPRQSGRARTIDFAGGVLVANDFSNGEVDVIDPSTGAVTGQYLTNMQKTLTTPGDFADAYDTATDGSKVYITNLGSVYQSLVQGDFESFDPSTNTFATLPVVAGPYQTQPTVPGVSGASIDEVDYTLGGINFSNVGNNTARFIPIIAQGANAFQLPGALGVASDGTVWFPCYASAATFRQMCVGHSVYMNGWSVWPSSSISLYGAGAGGAQIMGIMEPANANSGPFTATSSDTSICTVANLSDHNFNIVGQSGGACTVTVTDAHNASVTIQVAVTTTSGTVQARPAGGVK